METKKERTIVIGDIHGCIDEFEELLKVLSYHKDTDRLILLGDLIDRGPDSVAVVRKAREMDLECVKGNHEYKFIKWYRSHGTKNDVYDGRAHYTQFSDEDINYIHRMSDYIVVDDFVIVHAGLRPHIPLEKQSRDDLFYIRYVDDDKKFVSLKKINQAGSKEAVGARFWTEFWDGATNVVYGHNVHGDLPRVDVHPYSGKTCYGIDTGACFGGKLTALILETKEIIQVQSKRVYYQSTFEVR
jgi:bis(5'-nucleosyl)-tetraphosphatase (symmetrical)